MDSLDIEVIKKRSIQSVVTLISRQFVLQLISFGAFLVITAHLTQTDIGIYTVVTAIQYIISFFTDFGLAAAMVQKKEKITQQDITTTFTLQVTITGLLFIIIFLLRPFITHAFRLPVEAGWLLVVLVFTIFLSSFKMISSVLLERNIQFQKLVIPQIAEALTFNILLVVLVLRGLGLTSYTYAVLASTLISLPIYYFIAPWKIEFGIHKSSYSALKFGAKFQLKSILGTIKDNVLIVILPVFISYAQIGYIGFASKWAFFVYRYFVDSVTKVTFSTYSRLQNDTKHLRKTIEKSLFFVATCMFPVLTGLMIVMPYVIHYYPKWQNKWEPATIAIIFLSLNAMVSSLSGILITVLDSTGRINTSLRLMIIWTILIWILTPVCIYFFGFNGVPIASFLVTLTIVYTVYLVKQFVRFDFWGSINKPLFSSVIMGIIIFFLARTIVNDFLTLFFVILSGGSIYFILMMFFYGKTFLNDIKKIIQRHE